MSLRDLGPACLRAGAGLQEKTLHFNPEKRLSADDAMKHPYVAKFHDAANEPVMPGPVRIPIDDNTKFGIAEYRDKLYGEVVRRRRETRSKRRGSSTKLAGADKAGRAAASTGGAAAGGAAKGKAAAK